jgi:hypothetical protein
MTTTLPQSGLRRRACPETGSALSCLGALHEAVTSVGRSVITDTDRAIRDCWQCIADAECEHDLEHARRALARLTELVPQQRENDELRKGHGQQR